MQVFRLVTKGTIEEIKYLRQVYKTHLTHATIPDNQSEIASTRLFEGVAKDKYRRGELFGIANLLKFSEDTFMNYATKSESKETNKYYGQLGNDIHSVEALQTSLKNLSEEEKEAVFLDEEDVFPNLATRKGTIGYLSVVLSASLMRTNLCFDYSLQMTAPILKGVMTKLSLVEKVSLS